VLTGCAIGKLHWEHDRNREQWSQLGGQWEHMWQVPKCHVEHLGTLSGKQQVMSRSALYERELAMF
jgi:hypothetical protein